MESLNINGKKVSAEELSDEARQTLASIRYADKRLAELKDQVAVTQTGIITYARELKGKLPKPAHPNKKKDTVTIDQVKYNFADFDQNAKPLLYSLDKANKIVAQLESDIAIFNTAMAAYKYTLAKQVAEKTG